MNNKSLTASNCDPGSSKLEGAGSAADAGMITKNILRDCLYFTANALARTISRMAEEEFRITGLSPSHAFLLMLVVEEPGTTQKALGESLQLAPSTVTRLIDTLVHRDLLTRKSIGRTTTVFPTQEGKQILSTIQVAWERLHQRYRRKLGEEGEVLTQRIDQAQKQLEG